MSRQEVVVPDIGGAEAADVVEVLVAVGDHVEVDHGLVVLESDKASMEVPATLAGTVVELAAAEGAQLAEGDLVAVIEAAGEADTGSAAASAPDATSAPIDDDGQTSGDARPASGRLHTVKVPDAGSDEGVDLVEVAVVVGDRVAEGDTLVVLESDKASVEVPAPAAGTVTALHASEGQRLGEGDPLLDLQSDAGSGAADVRSDSALVAESDAAGATVAAEPETAGKPQRRESAPAAKGQPGTAAGVYAGPAVRRLAREFGIPLDRVRGSGPRGRILKEDLHRHNRDALAAEGAAAGGAGLPEVPKTDFSQFGPVEVVERSRIDRVTADNMRRSWLNVPHVTQFDDADITELDRFRKSLRDEGEQRGTRMTLLPFLLKACAVALRRHERLNASLSDGGSTLTLKRYVHIGVAVDTPVGLMVPVLRDVDRKSLWELAAEVAELASSARERKLSPTQMQGAGFTVSSLGAIGGRGFTPIVNTPEVAILGVGRATTAPRWDGQAFQPRLQLPLALSYDHRVVNGGDGGRFLTELRDLLEDLRRLLL